MGKLEDQIVHICQRQAWQVAVEQGEYRAQSVETEGFIHCSRPDQILRVANAIYRGVPDLVLLWIDLHKVRAEIRWEAANGETFPHIYGALNLDAVARVQDFTPSADGIFHTIE